MVDYIKEFFDLGLYKEEDLDVFVQTNWITEDEKKEIIKVEK